MREIKIKRFKDYFYTVDYSPDDGGYYAEIFGVGGETIHSTEITVTRADAESLARIYINEYLGERNEISRT